MMSPRDDSNDEMHSIAPVHLESYLKGLFDVPSKNIESAFELVLGSIKQQSSEINELKNAHREALENNDLLKSHIERLENELANEKADVATEFQQLKRDHKDLLLTHEKSLATIDAIQQEVAVSKFVEDNLQLSHTHHSYSCSLLRAWHSNYMKIMSNQMV